jgi:hypothetical protein
VFSTDLLSPAARSHYDSLEASADFGKVWGDALAYLRAAGPGAESRRAVAASAFDVADRCGLSYSDPACLGWVALLSDVADQAAELVISEAGQADPFPG